MDNKLFYGREEGYEAYDYLTPRLPKFYRYRILFWDFIGYMAAGNKDMVDELCSSDDLLKFWYKQFYNMTKVGEEKPITICDVKMDDPDYDDEEAEKAFEEENEDSICDIESHRDEVRWLMRTNLGYKKVITKWEHELMSDNYYGKTKK